MASLAYPRESAPVEARRGGLPAVFAQRGSDLLLGVVLLVLAAALLANIAGEFSVDSWLELVTGRQVWLYGIPHNETLTLLAHGAPWVDQQWLSQLAGYAIYLIGGLGLLGLVNVGLFTTSFAASVAAARHLGAPFKAVLLTLPLSIALVAPSREVRTQEFAMPLFVGLVYLLATDARCSSRRVYWCLPVLVLWANLHGTVTLGAMLVALRGIAMAWERRHALARSVNAWKRPLLLSLGAPISILLTPYGLSIIGYYRTTLLGSTLRRAVTEWQPITSVPTTAAAFFVLAGIAVWSFGRSASRTTLWERLALLALAAATISAVRNAVFFGLFTMMVVPLSLPIRADADRRPADHRRAAVNAVLVGAAAAAVLIAIAATLLRPASSIELQYQRTKVLTAVERATQRIPSLHVLTDGRFADWLLWRDPALAGRIANDARYELLTPRQIDRVDRVFAALGTRWKQGARGFRLLVLDRKYDPRAVKGFLAEPGRRILYNDGERMVLLRTARAAA